MRAFTIITAIIVLLGCAKKPGKDITGHYETPEYNRAQISWAKYINNEIYSFGNSMDVNKDSTFTYQTCANIIEGNWTLNEDTLFLHVTSNHWRLDSFNKYGYNGKQPVVSDKPLSFYIRHDRLVQEFDSSMVIEERKYNQVTELVKVE